MSGQSALLVGATGQTGRLLLKELLGSSHFTRVGEYGRRVTDAKDLSPEADKAKLQQKVIDFEKLEAGAWKEDKWDVVFITLGTTKAAAGTAEAFEKIDRDYVVNAAKAAKADGIDQRLVYVSSGGAGPTSSFLYTRSKGLTEEALAALRYKDTIVFRLGLFLGVQRAESRLGEVLGGPLMNLLNTASPIFGIQISDLAKSLLIAGQYGSSGLPTMAGATQEGRKEKFTLIGNKGALALSKATI